MAKELERLAMTIACEETAVERYNRLYDELQTLRRIEPAQRTKEHSDRYKAVSAELLAILAIAPEGYTLPKAAADLIAHAEAHGWKTMVQWTHPGWEEEKYVMVRVGREVDEAEREQFRGDGWFYKLTWHSRGCAPGRLRLFGSGLAETPDNPATHDAPSVRRIRAIITEHRKVSR
ncbi:hypothetical protein ACI2L4_25115 [Streptomyces sparsogenes]|uniref:hypothetical protein n=1 Tax=Streptomyces sparsogenes TaxID=67365 RepID=UPI00384B92C1